MFSATKVWTPTRVVEHMRENMAALSGPMPDAAQRRRMAEYFDRVAA